jgi:hypothetical protein
MKAEDRHVPDITSKSRGAVVDLATQRWVRATGTRVALSEHSWLDGPVGDVDRIGMDFFSRFAAARGWKVLESGTPGLLESFAVLRGPTCESSSVAPEIVRFYEQTSDYDFQIRSKWSGLFRPFGGALSSIFSTRLQQLNVPLSPLDTELGVVSRVLQLFDEHGRPAGAAWVREAVATGQTVYAGSYSHCRVPGFEGECVRVAFPLPNGYALVVLKPESYADGSFALRSEGSRFGDPGFYFFVQSEPGNGWARYVSSFKESIHVFEDGRGRLRAEHVLSIWGVRFLCMQYRMRRKSAMLEQ